MRIILPAHLTLSKPVGQTLCSFALFHVKVYSYMSYYTDPTTSLTNNFNKNELCAWLTLANPSLVNACISIVYFLSIVPISWTKSYIANCQTQSQFHRFNWP